METAQAPLPRFRTDLVAQPIDEEGQRFVDVTDPDSGATFRFYDVEYSIACAMDGQRDVGSLADWALEELGLEASPEELETVISTLDELGYLEMAELGLGFEVPAVAPAAMGVEAEVAAAEEAEADLAEALELGAAGGTPEDATLGVGSQDVGASDLELGAPGKSPVAPPRPEPPRAPEVELGRAGGDARISVPPPVELERAPKEADSAPVEAKAGEMSFAGLLDDDEAPTSVRVTPTQEGLDEAASALQAGEEVSDEAPTTVREDASRPHVSMPDFDDEEGLTPPPAEQPVPTLTPSVDAYADEDGPTNLPPPQVPDYDDDDVSVDLSQHLSIDAEDVKEAVRASQVMDAVEVPDDLMAEVEAAESGERPEAAAPPSEPEPALTPEPPAPAPAEPVPVAAMPARPPVAEQPPPTELPERPAVVAKKVAAAREVEEVAVQRKAEEVRKGVSLVLLFLLFVVIVGGAAAYYFLVYKDDSGTKSKPPTTRKTGPGEKPTTGPAKPTPPPVVTAKLVVSEPSVETVKMSRDGFVSWIAATGAEVAAGDRVAKLREFERHERKIREARDREKHYQARLDRATGKLEQAKAAGNKAAVKRYQAEVARYQAKVEEKRLLFAKHAKGLTEAELKAPVAGKVERAGRGAGYFKTGNPVAKISLRPVLEATFTLPKGTTAGVYPEGNEVELTKKGAPDTQVTCTVTASGGDKVTVSCPTDGALAGGDEVILK